MKRRDLFKAGLGAAGLGTLGSLALPGVAAAGDYRAVVCVFLAGGNDGHNTLIPTDGAYSQYAASRSNLALSKGSLVNLQGTTAGHTFGVHPGMAPLADLYHQERLAFISNVGPLIEPLTAGQVMNHVGRIPPFLLSHSDQVAIQQGWGADEDASGWAGRALEKVPNNLRNRLNAVTMDNNRTLVLGKNSPVAFLNPYGSRHWGRADLAQPSSEWAQTINRMAQWQFANQYEAEYSRTFGGAVFDSTLITQAQLQAQQPSVPFEDNQLAVALRALASLMPVFRAGGYRRQVFLVNWGSFDTHSNQRGVAGTTQDTQLGQAARAMAAFDQANVASGMGDDVVTIAMSDFGRTLRPASGGGSDHAWGNHWWVMGGGVQGGQVVGTFPTLTLGGPNDCDPHKGGRFVPTTSTDQVGCTLMQWLGMPSSATLDVFPDLANFSTQNLGFMSA